MHNILTAADKYLSNGINVLPTRKNKRPNRKSWKELTTRKITIDEFNEPYNGDLFFGIGIICGAISGNLEVIDVDCKYDLTGTLFNDLLVEIPGNILSKLLIIETQNKGYHIYYRCPVIAGNTKIAQREATEEEKKATPGEKVLVLIESRGEGGYVIAPPTEGYKKKQGALNEITPDERETIWEIGRSFNQYIIEQQKPQAVRNTEGFAVTPWEDYNNRGVDDMLKLLDRHGWRQVETKNNKIIFKRPGKTESKSSGDYSYKHNLFMVFTTSSEFEALKGYKPAAVFTVLEHKGNFSEAAKALLSKGFGQRKESFGTKLEKDLFQKKIDGYTRDELIKIVISNQKSESEAEEIINQLEKQWGEKLCIFWDVGKKTTINRSRFIDFLNRVGGFGLYFYDKSSTIYRIVKVKDGIVEESSTEQMKKFLIDYIETLPDSFDGGITPDDLKEIIIRQYSQLFTEGFLEFLPRMEFDFLKDNQDEGYFPFKNGIVVVNKTGISISTYKKYVWKNQINDFEITIDSSFNEHSCEYYNFIEKICNDEDVRIEYCLTLIGYMLHRYKDPAKPFAIVLAEETESDKEGGGTGKGIFIKALTYLLRTVIIDGKNFKIDKNFSLQRVGLDTQFIVIEDCDRSVDFEKFNSQISEGSTVEKKNKDELFIEYKDSPKFGFTTNYSLNIKGNHGKRRSKIFEFSPFFTLGKTPLDHFGHRIFESWDTDEWNRFYNLMFHCLQVYIIAGIKEVGETEKMKKKGLKQEFGDEFLEWITEYCKNGCDKFHSFSSMYDSFMKEAGHEKTRYSAKKFKKGLDSWCIMSGLTIEKRRTGLDNVLEYSLGHDNRVLDTFQF